MKKFIFFMDSCSVYPIEWEIMSELYEVIDSLERPGLKIEVLEYRNLVGNALPSSAQSLFYAEKVGLKMRQVRMTLKDHEVVLEAGALHFMKGDISMEIPSSSIGGFLKRAATSIATGEALIKPKYRGSGEIYLEPSFQHYLIMDLEDTQMIADRGLFLGGDSALVLSAARQKNLAAGLLGGEGFFQTQVKGSGACVLQIPVPVRELMSIELNQEVLKVDGTFALLRLGDVEFTVEKSTRSLLGSAASGEGLLQVFRGKGQVWLAPTLDMGKLMMPGISGVLGNR